MIPLRCAAVLLTVLSLAASAFAQQQRQRRVFTNEDFRSAPAPAPTPAPAPAPAAAPQPAATPASPEAAAAASETPAAAVATADEPGPDAPASGLKERLQRLEQVQVALRITLDEFAQREQEETDPVRKARWNSISACMVAVMQGYQEVLRDLQAQLKQLESAPAAP